MKPLLRSKCLCGKRHDEVSRAEMLPAGAFWLLLEADIGITVVSVYLSMVVS